VVAESTGHAALHLALMAAGAGPGDEVITPSFNNVADFQAIVAVGASPVFCDIDPVSLCVDLDRAEDLISPRTRALIVMDYDCVLCDHDRVADLAARRGIRIVHDAAHSLGSRHRGRPVGSFSDIAMFSFDPVKTITCIDGGALVVRTEAEANALREMRLIGMGQPSSVMYQNQRAWTYDVARLGFRYHLANLHAAIGLAQLGKLDVIAATRREACRVYNARLSGVPGITVPQTDFADVTPFLYYVRVEGDRRDAFRRHLAERGIDTGIHWQPGHWFQLFRDCRRGELPVTERVGREIVSLPLHSKMAASTLDRVCEAVLAFFAVRA
jgi:dTDP-4-amino-4,6-dideoxygalactose transaminase